MNQIGRPTVMAMLLIAAWAVIWNLLGIDERCGSSVSYWTDSHLDTSQFSGGLE